MTGARAHQDDRRLDRRRERAAPGRARTAATASTAITPTGRSRGSSAAAAPTPLRRRSPRERRHRSDRVAVDVSPTATFSEAMNPATLTTSTFTLVQQGQSTPLPATVSYAAQVATLDPSFQPARQHHLHGHRQGRRLRGEDVAGHALAADSSWSFTTAAGSDTTPPTITAQNADTRSDRGRGRRLSDGDLLRGDEPHHPDHEHLHARSAGPVDAAPGERLLRRPRRRRSTRAPTCWRAPPTRRLSRAAPPGRRTWPATRSPPTRAGASRPEGRADDHDLPQRPHLDLDDERLGPAREGHVERRATAAGDGLDADPERRRPMRRASAGTPLSDVRYALAELHALQGERRESTTRSGSNGSVVFEVYAGATKVYDERPDDRATATSNGRRLHRRREPSCAWS